MINNGNSVQDIDKWLPIRPFVDAFNKCRREHVKPGEILVVDELMSMWYGLDGKYALEGAPHVTKIQRKPRGVGVEIKAVCDGESNIMLGLEIMEGVLRQHAKEYHAAYGSGTSITLRLCSPWRGSGRTIIGDSAFASVKTLIALHKELSLFFMGIVKTASTKFPKQFMQKWYSDGCNMIPARQPGSWITLRVSYNTCKR
jgi:hypothetical protein